MVMQSGGEVVPVLPDSKLVPGTGALRETCLLPLHREPAWQGGLQATTLVMSCPGQCKIDLDSIAGPWVRLGVFCLCSRRGSIPGSACSWRPLRDGLLSLQDGPLRGGSALLHAFCCWSGTGRDPWRASSGRWSSVGPESTARKEGCRSWCLSMSSV